MFSKRILLIVIFLSTFMNQIMSQECGQNVLTSDVSSSSGDVDARMGAGDLPTGVLWPWMASLGRLNQSRWLHNCAGSLISERHVLTAAHCVRNLTKVTAVTLGGSTLTNGLGRQRRLVYDAEMHPKYVPGIAYYDVAVVTLDPPVDVGSMVTPVCLPYKPFEEEVELDQEDAHSAGWGLTVLLNRWSTQPVQLRQFSLKIYSNSYCNSTYSSLPKSDRASFNASFPRLFTPNLMCVGNPLGVVGSCKGDSGAPLIIHQTANGGAGSGGRFVQVGINHGGVGFCTNEDYPGIFTRLDHKEILDFVKEAMGKGSSLPSFLARILFRHVDNNDLAGVRRTLRRHGDDLGFVDVLVENGSGLRFTSLYSASFDGYTDIVRELVVRGGADPNIKTNKNFTALYVAAQSGHIGVVKILVETAKADMDAANGLYNSTALGIACSKEQSVVVDYLIEQGVQVDKRTTEEGSVPLWYAVLTGSLRIVKSLVLDGKAEVDLLNGPDQKTALMTASELGWLRIAKFLIEVGGADVNVKSPTHGYTALYLASIHGRTGIVEYLIKEAKADSGVKNLKGFSALYAAAQEGYLDIVKILVEDAGEDVEGFNGQFNTTVLQRAADVGNTGVVRYLLGRGADANYVNLDKITSLYYAANNDHLDVVKALVEDGDAEVDAINGSFGWTALHKASSDGHLRIVEYLVDEAGADFAALTGDGFNRTAADLAKNNHHDRVVEFLTIKEAPEE